MFYRGMRMSGTLMSGMGILAASMLVLPPQAAGAEGSSVVQEIVVTAQRREQNAQDVGIAITAFSAVQMNELGFSQAVDVVA